jgi:hypothetical protein
MTTLSTPVLWDYTLYMQSMQYSPRELEGGHMALHELMKLFFCLMILYELDTASRYQMYTNLGQTAWQYYKK